MKPLLKKVVLIVAVLALLFFATSSTQARTCVANSTGNWSTPATWVGCGASGIPVAGDTVKIVGAFTVTVDVSNAVTANIQVGGTSGSGTATLVFNAGSQLTVSGPITLGGTTTTTNGTINMTNGGTLIAGSLALSAFTNIKTWIPGSGTVQLTANNTLPASIFTAFNNLIVSAGTTTLGTNTSVIGNLTFTGGKITANSFNLAISGNWTNNSSTTALTGGTGTVSFIGSTGQTIGGTFATTFNNLSLANSASTVTLSINTNVGGNLSVSSGTFDLATFTANRVSTGGVLTVANNATLKIGGTNTFPANYTTNTLVLASTVEYSGTDQTVSSQTYGNLKLSSSTGAAVKTFPGTAFTVEGNLSSVIGAGTSVSFTAAANVTVSGSLSIGASTTFNGGSYSHNIGGNWVNNGTFNGNTGTIILSGAGAAVSGPGTQNFNNLTITDSFISFPASTITVTGNLATTGSGSLTQAVGGTFLMSGTSKTISGSGISIDSLTVSGTVTTASSVTLSGDLSVGGSLVASAGTITMNGASKTISGAGTKSFSGLFIAGSVSTANDFSVSAGLTVNGSFSASSGTATFTGSSTLSGTANLYNVTLNGTSLQLATNAMLGIANVLTITAGTLNVTSTTPNTVNFNGSGLQNINGITYNDLKLSNGGTKTALTGITIEGSLTIATGTTFIPGVFTHSIYQDWNNSGSFTAGASTIEFLGDQTSTINGATTFNILTVNKGSAATSTTLTNDVSVSTINMTSGTLLTGANTITITTTRTGNGKILGNIHRNHVFATGTAYAFEGPYNTITFSTVVAVTSITVSIVEGPVSDFPLNSSVNEQYSITIPAGTYNATLRLDYEDDELNGNDEATMTLWSYNGSSWVNSGKTANSTSTNYVEQSGLTNIATRWTLSNPGGATVVEWNGSTSSDWNSAANWTALSGTPSKPPSADDIVYLGTAAFTYHPTISTAATARNIHFGSAQALTLTLTGGGSLTSGNIGGAWTSNAVHTINVNNQTLTISGELSLSDGTAGRAIDLNIGGGTVSVAESITQSGGANVVFSGAGNLNVGDDYDYVSGTFTAGSSTVTYNGSGNQTVAGLTYNHLTINKTATGFINNTLTVGGNLTLLAGEIDNLSTTTINGNVSISSGAALHNYLYFHVKGNWTNDGTFIAAETASMFFDGSGTQYISASTFNNLRIDKPIGSSAILTGPCVVNSNIILTSGTLDLQGYACNRSIQGGSLTLTDAATLVVGGNNLPANFASNSFAASSTLIFNGTSAQSVSGGSFGNVIFRNAGVKTLGSPLTVNGDFTIENGSTFDGASQTLTLNGNWTNNGTFTASSSSILLTGASKTVSGNTTFNAVTVSGSYAVNGSNITYNGPMEVTATGTFSLGSGIATFNNDLTNSGSLTSTGIATLSGTTLQTLRFINAFSAQSTGTVNFNGTISPVLNFTITPSYGDLNINNTGGINCDVGWVVYGTMTVGTGASFNGGNSSHNFYGNIVNNGTITSSGALNLLPSATATLNMGSNFTSTGTVNFGGAGALGLAGTPSPFQNVVVANTNAAGITPSSDWTIANNLTVSSGAILNAGNRPFVVGGNILNSGTINAGTSTFILNGSGTQEVYTGSAFNNLTINKSADVVLLASDTTVNGVLNFVAGKIQTGSFRLIQPSTGSLTGAGQSTGWVNGNLQRQISTGATSKVLEVGGPNNYTPVVVAFANVTSAGYLTASAVSGDHASIGTSTINAAQSINRTWTLTNSEIVFTTYNATFNFVAGDVDAGAVTSSLIAGQYDGASWSYPTYGSRTATSTQATNLITFGDFQLGMTASIPNVTLTESVSPNGFVSPRTDLVYTIEFSNNGIGSALALVITDPIPANTDFKVGSATTVLGTTGLIPTITYSNDGGATWNYTPSSGAGGAPAGYDRNVTNVRWSFASSLSQTSPNNTGSVSFTARIR